MSGADFLAEHLTALRATRFADLKPITAAGVTWGTVALALPAYAQVGIGGDGTYEPDAEEGGAAFLLPVRVNSPISPETSDPVETLQDGHIVDIVAFHPRHPGRWALRTGAAEWLGAVEPRFLHTQPVPIRRSVLSWLQQACTGLVLLTNSPAGRYRLLSDCRGGIVAEDVEHAAELRRVLSRPWSAPRILISASGFLRDAA